MSDRIHGHLVTGHVDVRSAIKAARPNGETMDLQIALPPELKPLVWPKGSVTINGVSLTVNAVREDDFSVGLIPETLRRTNLGKLTAGDFVNLEADNSARGLLRFFELQKEIRV
jgi:riboflavin synthase